MNKLLFGLVGLSVIGGVVVGILGLRQVENCESYCFKVLELEDYEASTPSAYSFSIIDSEGEVVKDFSLSHTKLMHLIVVRKDLQSFQHLHPEFDQASGVFTLSDLNFPTDGEYRLFADFVTAVKNPVTVWRDVSVGADYQAEELGSTGRVKTFGSYGVTLATDDVLVAGEETELTFSLRQNNRLVTNLEEYLGAMGHSVILKEGSLEFIHVHPLETAANNGSVNFLATFPEVGNYKIFSQFQHRGEILLTDFVVEVTEEQASSIPPTEHAH